MNLRFRDRIALFTALAAAATIGLVFLVVYGVVYYTAINHLDNDIWQEKEEVLRELEWTADSILLHAMPEWEEKEHEQIEVNPTFIQIVDVNGRLLFRSSNLQQDILLFNPNLKHYAYFNSRIKEQRIRQGQFPIVNKRGIVIGHLSVGISQQESVVVLQNLRTTLWIAFPLLLVVLFLATALAASQGIAPVQQLIRAASNIGEANIQSRLPLPGNKDEIHQLATTINDLLQRLEGSVQREKQFTADASHEIRTPLTAIRGMLEVLTRKKREPEQYEQKIKLVINEVDRLHALIDQLLQLARLESARVPVNMAPVELHEFMADLASKWTPRLYQKKMTLRLQIPVQVIVTTDTSLLRFILDNIMENAYKYGNSGGHIECSWHMQDKSLTISDNGPGIPEIHLSHIFDRFYRTDSSRSSEVQGVGLGLSIAQKMADLLQIHLTVGSREGEGTAFILFFR